jgi:hypothetical protein
VLGIKNPPTLALTSGSNSMTVLVAGGLRMAEVDVSGLMVGEVEVGEIVGDGAFCGGDTV